MASAATDASGWRRLPVGVLLTLLAVAVAALNPVGYIGGGNDDWQYLVAAECWAANGPCLPHDHWSTRWPLIAPMAAAISALGVERMVIGIVPFLYAVAVLFLFAAVAERLFDRRAALTGGVALLLTPVFAADLLQPNVDVVELAFLLAVLLTWLRAIDGSSRSWAVAAGIFMALAVQTRETSLAYGLVFAGWFLAASLEHKKVLIWAALGFAVPLAIEFAIHAAATGEPLLRLRLALGHTRIPSDELSESVDLSRSPLFNPDFIGGWVPANGIDAHWTVRPVVNLLSHPLIGFTVLTAFGARLLAGRKGFVDPKSSRRANLLLVLPALGALVLMYVLAIDPKPRSFLPLLAGSALVLGAMVSLAWARGDRLIAIASAAILSLGVVKIAMAPGTATVEPLAASWLAEAAGPVTVDETSRRFFALVPEARALRVGDPTATLRMRVVQGTCAENIAAGEALIREADLFDGVPSWLHWTRPPAAPGQGRSLCLFERRRSS